jgi:hypothetical protein
MVQLPGDGTGNRTRLGEYAVFGLGEDGFAGLAGPEPGHDGDRRRDRDRETRAPE